MTRLLSRVSSSTLLALACTVPAALIAAVLIGHDAFLARQRLTREGIRYGQTLGEPLVRASQRSQQQGAVHSLQEVIEDLGRGRWVRKIVLVGGDGRVVASSRRDWIGLEEGVIGEAGGGEAAAARASRQPQNRLIDDGRRLALVWPLALSGPGQRGLLYIEIDLEERRRELAANVLKRGVFSVLGVLGFGVCLHFSVRAMLTNRIREVAAYAAAVARGESRSQPAIAWPREVAQIVRDVGHIGSALRHREASLRASEEALRTARHLESITSRASSMAHDLNNLLTGVLGYARLLLDRVGQGDPIRRQLATIENAATRAADLTGQLLILEYPTAKEAQLEDSGAAFPPGIDATASGVMGAPPAPAGPGVSPIHAVAPASRMDPASPHTILAVDDESTVLALAKDVLEMHGYVVLTARNGEEALRVFRARREEIHLVLLDLTMPVMGGRECFREMRRIDPHVRVVISSGFSSENSASDVMSEGAIDYLQKPYDIDCLARTVAAALERPEPRAAAGSAG